jgi:hypothetical protein
MIMTGAHDPPPTQSASAIQIWTLPRGQLGPVEHTTPVVARFPQHTVPGAQLTSPRQRICVSVVAPLLPGVMPFKLPLEAPPASAGSAAGEDELHAYES